MRRKRKVKKDCIVKKFEGLKVTIVKHSFLPRGTIALSTDLFEKIREDKDA